MASGAATTAARRNQRERGRSRFRHQATTNQSASSDSALAAPTITSNARWTMVEGGRSAGGTAFMPTIFVSARKPVRNDARSGIGMPPVGTPSFMWPPSRSGTWVAVSATISIAANLTGCSRTTSRIARSPTSICSGIASAAMVNGMRKPRRCRRSRRPLSIPTA